MVLAGGAVATRLDDAEHGSMIDIVMADDNRRDVLVQNRKSVVPQNRGTNTMIGARVERTSNEVRSPAVRSKLRSRCDTWS